MVAASDKIFKISGSVGAGDRSKNITGGSIRHFTQRSIIFLREDREIPEDINLRSSGRKFLYHWSENPVVERVPLPRIFLQTRDFPGRSIGGVPLSEVNETNLMEHSLGSRNDCLFKGTVEENLDGETGCNGRRNECGA